MRRGGSPSRGTAVSSGRWSRGARPETGSLRLRKEVVLAGACRTAPRPRLQAGVWRLAIAHADGSYAHLLARLAKADVLVLDDWGLAEVGATERRDLNEIMDDQYGLRSTVITSQLPTSKWHDHLGDPTTADAICDRILSDAHRIKLTGPSRRKEESNLSE